VHSVNQQIATGAAWALITKLLVKGLGFFSTLVLAHILSPEDFGLIALATTVIALLEIFASFSFDLAVIQRREVGRATLDSAWTCKILAGISLSVILFFASTPISIFFDDNRLAALVVALSILPTLNGTTNIGFVLYRKELNLRKEFLLEGVAKSASVLTTLAGAMVLANYWALVVGIVVHSSIRVALSFAMHPYRPRATLVDAPALFSFSKWVLLNNLLIFFNHKLTDLFIGRTTSATEVGYYTLSFEISNLPTSQLVFPISRAVFPGYAKLKDDLPALRDSFVKVTKLIMVIAAPVCLTILGVAEELVPVMLGSKWLPIVPIISLLSLYGLVRCAVQNTGSVYLAIGKPHLTSAIAAVRLLLVFPLLATFVPSEGALGGAKAVLIAAIITGPLALAIAARELTLKARELVAIFAFPLVSSVGMFMTIQATGAWSDGRFHSPLGLLTLKLLIGTVTYLVCCVLYVRLYPSNNVVRLIYSNVTARIHVFLNKGPK